MKIKKNDIVIIISGKDRGKKSKVIQVLPEQDKVVVEEANIFVKHLRPRKSREKGQKVQFNAPMLSSNVMLVCPKCGKQTRVGYKILENKKKVRICRKCKEVID
ncbi:MAG: 50S ribosomal protein L24 [Patescibacteria group bacterium]|nr:50S ribosomal protein L24 [Patescibacteria group bacterium]MDD5567480.1 50S ribosomal protein L24 [Patescibacteria group bacterium]